jgi:hypothetical protein
MEGLNTFEGVKMKKIYLVLLTLTIIGCGAPQKQVWEDHYDFSSGNTRDSYTVSAEPKFSDDPLLDSIYRDRYLKCLEKCSKCDK